MATPDQTQEFELDAQTIDDITRDIDAHEAERELLARPNVIGLGVGTRVVEQEGRDTGEPCIKVLVSQKLPKELLLNPDDFIPKNHAGKQTDVVEVGEIFAGAPPTMVAKSYEGGASGVAGRARPGRAEPEVPLQGLEESIVQNGYADLLTPGALEAGIQLLANRVRPAEGGYSVGHFSITAGTYSTAVFDRTPFPGIPRKTYVLSNNHVLANSNVARIGDPILQPGPADGGTFPADVIARLSRFVTINFLPSTRPNYVDAAIAEGPFHWLDREIYWIGYVKGVRAGYPRVGELVQKTGRTTNYTTGRVTAINATVNVNYGAGRIARFIRQIVTTNMSAGGDSGSLVLDHNENALGLLYAGSSQAMILKRIDYVQSLLGIRVV